MIGIYKITNPKGLIYIGQSKNLHNRFINYKSDNVNYKSAIRQSIKKYGYESHKFEILEQCDKCNLDVLEKKYIIYHDSFNNGLNYTTGGKNGFKGKLETYEKISQSLKGRKRPEYVINKILETKRNNPVIVSKETRLKMSLKSKGNKSHCKKVKVTIGFYYAVFNSLKESANALNLTRTYLSRFINNNVIHPDFKIEYI